MVEDPDRLPSAPERSEAVAPVGGIVAEIRPRPLGEAVVALGGGRALMHQPVDPRVGFVLHVAPGDSVEPGDLLGVVHARSADEAELGVQALKEAIRIGGEGAAVVARPLVSGRIEG